MLTCGACGEANPAGSRFCSACGSPLGLACPSCGEPVDEGQRFCRRCGAPLLARPAPLDVPAAAVPDPAPEPDVPGPVAERRVCSVLFVDLVGFTPLSEARDPEEVRELLTQYFDAVRTVITRYGGSVEKFIGDAVVAVWGAPTATEADAERAVRAGLDVLAAVADLGEAVSMPGLRARGGIVTGETAVTLGARGQGMLAGDTVNTAARVQSVAEPGCLWVDESTYRLARAAIGFADKGQHSLKGKTGTTRLWGATRVLSGIGGTQRVDGLEAPMLGRDQELRAVRELFHASVERRRPRLVLVSGPAGVGKSRLGWEFEKYTDGLALEIFWHRGRCLSYGDGVAFWALAEIVRMRLDIAEDDPRDAAVAKLLEGVAACVADEKTRAYVALRLARLLGVRTPDDKGDPLAQDELFAGWRVFFEQLAETSPVVLVVEDAEHADQGLLDFLDHLVDWARDVPVFALVLARPELEQRHPGWGTGRNRSTLTLDPLDRGAMDRLVDALVPGMPAAARTAIVNQSQGLPLFAVETVRALVDRDVVVPQEGVYRLVGDIGRLSVPESLHALLAARLDGLDPALREVVADTAVLGTSFAPEAVVAVSQRPESDVRAALQELLRREVLTVSADPLSPQRGAYRFAQDLLRQVSYETMSRRDRKRRHLAAAEHLCVQWCDEGEAVADVIARHHLDALAAVPDDPDVGEIRADAVVWLERAGERSAQSGAPGTAAASFVQAAQILEAGADPDRARVAHLLERAAESRLANGDRNACIALVDQARPLYEGAGETRKAASLQVTAARALQWEGRLTEALDRVTSALDVLSVDPGPDTVRALGVKAALAAFGGAEDSLAVARDALALGQDVDVDRGQLAELFVIRGIAAHMCNRSAEAVSDVEHAVHLCELGGYGSVRARALLNLSNIYGDIDFRESARTAKTGCAAAREVGEPFLLAFSSANLIQAQLFLGDWVGAEGSVRVALEEDELESEMVDVNVAMLRALRGDVERARQCADLPRMRSSEDAQDAALAGMLDATIEAALGHPVSALEAARSTLAHAPVIGLRHEATRWAWPLAARAAWDIGDDVSGQQLLAMLADHPKGHIPPVLRAERSLAAARFAARDDGDLDAIAAAVDEQRAVGSPYFLGHGLLDLAEARRAAAGGAAVDETADAAVAEAAAIARRLGCRPLLDRAVALGASEVELPQPGTGGAGVTSPSSASAVSTSSREIPSK